jgi:hypothetical protein
MLSDQEARNALTMMWLATKFARMTLGGWVVDSKRPTKTAMMHVAHNLKAAEDCIADVASGEIKNGLTAFDRMAAMFDAFVDELDAANKKRSEREG